MDLLYTWANDPAVRKFSFQTDPIPYDVHRAWFDRMMRDPTVIQYILVDGDIPVGQIRLNTEGNEAEIGYSIAPEHRGKGYGHKVLRLAAEAVRAEYPEITRLTAKVKPENGASKALFEKEGYRTQYLCYSLELSEGDTAN